ncbi:MAG: Burkholderia virus BcepC6B [Pseudomonadota bacterium]
MASVIDVANRALTKLGAARIVSLADDNKQARSINSCFYDLLEAELRQNRWTFAIKRDSLPAMAEAPLYGYQYQYALPVDFLRLDLVNDEYPWVALDNYVNTEIAEYTIENKVILTNLSAPLKTRYGANVTDPAQWDALFREALACRLAAEICEDLTQSTGKRDQAWKEYARALSAAKRANAVERPPAVIPDDTWIFSRL